MSPSKVLSSVRYVTDSEGRPTGVLLDIKTWKSLLAWVEDATDTQLAAKALTELAVAGSPEKAGWLDWDEVREDWGGEEAG